MLCLSVLNNLQLNGGPLISYTRPLCGLLKRPIIFERSEFRDEGILLNPEDTLTDFGGNTLITKNLNNKVDCNFFHVAELKCGN